MQMRAALSKILPRRGTGRKSLPAIYNFTVLPRSLCSNASGVEEPSSAGNTGNGRASDDNAGTTSTVEQYDIAVVGGGMVGLAFACALSSMRLTRHLSLAIIDSNPALKSAGYLKKDGVDFSKQENIPDPRVSTVTPATISFFKEIGAWDYVQQQRHAFFDQMQVWDYTGLGYTRYNARDVGNEYLGCVVENKVLCSSLLSCLQNADIQKTIHCTKLTSMTFGSQNPYTRTTINVEEAKGVDSDNTVEKPHHGRMMKLDLSDGKRLFAKLVVGADGSKSRVRETAGLKTTGWDYSQSAIICTVEHTVQNHCAWQRFLPSGPIALLPICDNFSNIVWTMTPEGASDHKLMSEDDFVKAVNHALDHGYGSYPQSGFLDHFMDKLSSFTRQGSPSITENFQAPPKVVKLVSQRMAFPLSLMHAHEYASNRVALIGDAAHAIHPLAGQGVNLGFGDASALSKVISEGISVGTDIGELSLLKKYEKERKAANVTMMALLDGFQKAYSVDFGPINLLRAAAFHGAQYIPPLKRSIISYAMGEQRFPIFS